MGLRQLRASLYLQVSRALVGHSQEQARHSGLSSGSRRYNIGKGQGLTEVQ